MKVGERSDGKDGVGLRGIRYLPRSLGSKMSLRASPAKAKPNTVIEMATPGKMRIQGAVAMYWAAWPVSMRPQEGGGSEIPNPRKLRPASARMAVPNMEDMMIRNGATVLGATWRNMILRSEAPMARAAVV